MGNNNIYTMQYIDKERYLKNKKRKKKNKKHNKRKYQAPTNQFFAEYSFSSDDNEKHQKKQQQQHFFDEEVEEKVHKIHDSLKDENYLNTAWDSINTKDGIYGHHN